MRAMIGVKEVWKIVIHNQKVDGEQWSGKDANVIYRYLINPFKHVDSRIMQTKYPQVLMKSNLKIKLRIKLIKTSLPQKEMIFGRQYVACFSVGRNMENSS